MSDQHAVLSPSGVEREQKSARVPGRIGRHGMAQLNKCLGLLHYNARLNPSQDHCVVTLAASNRLSQSQSLVFPNNLGNVLNSVFLFGIITRTFSKYSVPSVQCSKFFHFEIIFSIAKHVIFISVAFICQMCRNYLSIFFISCIKVNHILQLSLSINIFLSH